MKLSVKCYHWYKLQLPTVTSPSLLAGKFPLELLDKFELTSNMENQTVLIGNCSIRSDSNQGADQLPLLFH